MPPPRPATEARSGSLEPGRPSRARSANTRNPAPAGRTRRPPTGCTRQTSDVRQHHRLMPPGRGHNNKDECLFDTLTLRSTPHVMLWWILPSISTDELLASSLICTTFASVAIYTYGTVWGCWFPRCGIHSTMLETRIQAIFVSFQRTVCG